MPNIRKLMRTQTAFKGPTALHLIYGYCLIAGGCGCCSDPDDADDDSQRWVLRVDAARELWQAYHPELIAQWMRVLEDADAPGFPCFGEVVFDGAKLPPVRAFWNDRAKELHASVLRAAAAVNGVAG